MLLTRRRKLLVEYITEHGSMDAAGSVCEWSAYRWCGAALWRLGGLQ